MKAARIMRRLRNLLKGRSGGRTMAALAVGAKAPDFELKTLEGRRASLNEELARGAVVLAFFKVSCPTCQYAFPFLERLHRAYGRNDTPRGREPQGINPNANRDADAALKGRSSTDISSSGISSSGISSSGRSSSGRSSSGGSFAGSDAALKGRSSTDGELPGGVSLIGVSQNDAKETAAFVKEFGITFPVLLDDTRSYPVSNAYGLTNVPSIFWVGQDGEIEVSSVGWLRADFEEINRRMAEAGKIAPAAVFRAGENVRDFQAG
jgi:peroxiredoxin